MADVQFERVHDRAWRLPAPFEDGDVVDLGADIRLEVVHTPGHTAGSVCYWWESAGLLVTGDSVQARGGRRGGLPVIEEAGSYAASLARVESIRPQTLLMAHY